MILITTSRKPSKRTRSLCREFSYSIPKSKYLLRGKKSIYDLVEIARSLGYNRIAIFKEKYGNPSRIDFIEIKGAEWEYIPFSLLIALIKLRREVSRDYKKLKLDSIKFKGNKLIKNLFNIFEEDIDSENIFYADSKFIKFIRFGKEIGPILKYRVLKWKKSE